VKAPAPRPPRREIFVLTAEEKRTVFFVLGAFFLGLGTMHYRKTISPAAAPAVTRTQNAASVSRPPRKSTRQKETTARPLKSE